jgi:hypothetical protein
MVCHAAELGKAESGDSAYSMRCTPKCINNMHLPASLRITALENGILIVYRSKPDVLQPILSSLTRNINAVDQQ